MSVVGCQCELSVGFLACLSFRYEEGHPLFVLRQVLRGDPIRDELLIMDESFMSLGDWARLESGLIGYQVPTQSTKGPVFLQPPNSRQ